MDDELIVGQVKAYGILYAYVSFRRSFNRSYLNRYSQITNERRALVMKAKKNSNKRVNEANERKDQRAD